MTKRKTPSKKKVPGRKSKWDLLDMDTKLLLVEGWTRDNKTEESMQKSLGVGHTTWNEWKKQKPEFVEALKKGREYVDMTVENQLLRRINGYLTEETEEMMDGDGNVVSSKKKVKEVAPSDTAILFYLKNRMGDKWNTADKKEITHSGGVNLSHISDEELAEELKRLKGELD